MPSSNNVPLRLAALRGTFGEWVYYVALMPVSEAATRIHYAEEIHSNKNLSEMIQRRVKASRGREIAEYLATTRERFFNSLVVAVYRGHPRWHEMALRNDKKADLAVGDLSLEVLGALGVLELDGGERLFALDGQHRIAGLRLALANKTLDPTEEISVVCVAHNSTGPGLQRTRRLFTTLNKTARIVGKDNIIALDEDDVVAICTRRLVETYPWFRGDRIAFKANNNITEADAEAFTTIGALYDTIQHLFRVESPRVLQGRRMRPEDTEIDRLCGYARRYFDLLRRYVPAVADFADAGDPRRVVSRHRAGRAPALLYRPVGLTAFTQVVAALAKHRSLEAAVALASRLPQRLDVRPFNGVLWEPERRQMLPKGRVLARDLMMFMVGARDDEKKLQDRLAKQAPAATFSVAELRRVRSGLRHQ